MPDIYSALDIFANDMIHIEHEDDNVQLLFFWSIKSKECVKPMKTLHEMVAKK